MNNKLITTFIQQKSILTKLFISLLAVVILLAACSTTVEKENETSDQGMKDAVVCTADVKQCPDGSFVSRDHNNNCEFPECPKTDQEAKAQEVIQQTQSDEVRELQEAVDNIKSFQYAIPDELKTVKIKDNKAVIIYSELQTEGEFKFDTIFLDMDKETAQGYCISNNYLCSKSPEKKYVQLSYADYEPENPYDRLTSLTNGEIVGHKKCESRQCDIIEYIDDGKRYRMEVKQRYVLPFRVVQMDDEDKETLIAQYTDSVFDSLKDADMVPPEDYTAVG